MCQHSQGIIFCNLNLLGDVTWLEVDLYYFYIHDKLWDFTNGWDQDSLNPLLF